MKKIFLLFVSCFMLATLSFAQKENNIWYFGNHAGIDFNSGTPVAVTGSLGQREQEGCATICNRYSGSLLFYTDGSTVWDKSGNKMLNGLGLFGHFSSTQSAVIVQMPGNGTKYYIFTADYGGYDAAHTPNRGIYYSIVDTTLNNGLGGVEPAAKNTLLLGPPTTEKIVAMSNCSGDSIWVVSHSLNDNKFYAWLVTVNGVASPVVSAVGSVHDGSDLQHTAGYLKFSPDGKKLALAVYRAQIDELFDFNSKTGIVSNVVSLPTQFSDYGVCFSPDNSRLYIAGEGNSGGDRIIQYDLLAGTPVQIAASGRLIGGDPFLAGMEIGPNGKIYVARPRGTFLDVINSPNSLGVACGFQRNAVSLNDTCYYGLQNLLVTSRPSVIVQFASIVKCYGDSVIFNDTSSITPDIRKWNFGDASSGMANTSALQNPKHYYSTPGTYTVTLTVQKGCITDSLKKTIIIPPPIVANAGQDITICRGDTVQLKATGGSTYYWSPGSPAAGLSNRNISNPLAHPYSTTKYSVKVTNANGCSDTDTVVVTILPPFAYTASPNPVNLGVTNVGKIKNGTITFTNTSSTNVRIRLFHFVNATFTGTILTPIPTSLSAGNSIDIHFTAAPPSEGVFTGDLCVEVDSACPATVCIPVKIEGVATCLKPNITTVVGEKPGDVTTIPIIVDPSTKFTTAKMIDLTVKYDPELLRLIDLSSSIGKVLITVPPSNGEVSFTITVDNTIITPTATLAELHVQALLAPYTTGTIDVTTSNFTLQSGEQLSGSSCPAEFTLGESCIHPEELKHRSSVSIEGIYPNPSYAKTTLVIAAKNNPRLRLEVYDTFGRQVEVLHDGEMSDGNYEVTINTEKYSNGIYFCRLIHNGQITTRAFNVER